jgi:hypothetical protein
MTLSVEGGVNAPYPYFPSTAKIKNGGNILPLLMSSSSDLDE